MSMTDTGSWISTVDAARMADWIASKRTCVLLTHTKPDGDALGSTLALARTINLVHRTSGAVSAAECWYGAPMPEWAPSLMGQTKCRVIEYGQSPPGAFDPEGVVICDTGAWGQLDPFRAFIEERLDRTAIIDHHLQGDAEIADHRLLDTAAAAVTQPVAEVCCRLLGLDTPARLPVEIATPLYVGLATDTGWFRHSNVDARVMRLAADLLEAGVEHTSLMELIEQRDRASRLRLMHRALGTLEIVDDKHCAIMSLTTEDFREAGAAPGESGGFVDIPRTVPTIRVVALLTEQEDAQGVFTKVSMRSKPTGWDGQDPVDVNQVCQKLGGGGHARASGARIRAPLAEAKKQLIDALP
ncbi:MAG: bifunctional oligoribonuclease/PAP phosphatase NrnA [Planctomycetota bacterium]